MLLMQSFMSFFLLAFCSDLQTFVHLVKASLGSGLLALPYAMSKVGYIVSVLSGALRWALQD